MVVGVSPTGEFHIIAPTFVPAGGRLHIIAEAVKGDVRSRLSSYDLVLRDAPLPAPSITSSSMAVGSLTQVSGTAMPGARVRVSIRVDGADDYRAPVEVMANMGGTWDLTLAEPLSYGTHIITAAQGGISGKADSAASSLNAYVRPAAPRIISPADGSWIAANQLPEAITGTAVPGATVELQVDADPTGMGETVALPLRTQADAAGNWSIPMSALIVGQHRIVAVQAVGLLPSDIALSAFHVTAAEVGPETPTLPVLPGTAGPDSGHKPVTVGNPGTGGVPVPVGNPGTGDGSLVLSGTLGTSSATDGVSATGTRTGGALAETGATDVGLLTGGGAALLVAGAAALIYGNRRRAVSDS
ncbi:hypothetical protein J2M53_04950 [Arthrobacter sp. zg-ZUI100]|uniref:hypothetical protein n=1 Tax=Arthrobacter jiangjiafuii TaxID=2817475 RepID=UPI001AEE86F6|nr:hypothetical protein [Arthrobacter jiangjiafuii]MBP3035605.1 hypothetical protein [Arthrobacter jiangjiafuii]